MHEPLPVVEVYLPIEQVVLQRLLRYTRIGIFGASEAVGLVLLRLVFADHQPRPSWGHWGGTRVDVKKVVLTGL